MQVRHGGHRHRRRCRASKLREAMHLLGLHQASAVVAAPLSPDSPPQPLAGSQRSITHRRSHPGLFPRLAVLARGNNCLRASLRYRRMAAFGVISTIGTHTGDRFMRWYLCQKFGQHGRISPTLLSVTSMARIYSVRASIPRCS